MNQLERYERIRELRKIILDASLELRDLTAEPLEKREVKGHE